MASVALLFYRISKVTSGGGVEVGRRPTCHRDRCEIKPLRLELQRRQLLFLLVVHIQTAGAGNS